MFVEPELAYRNNDDYQLNFRLKENFFRLDLQRENELKLPEDLDLGRFTVEMLIRRWCQMSDDRLFPKSELGRKHFEDAVVRKMNFWLGTVSEVRTLTPHLRSPHVRRLARRRSLLSDIFTHTLETTALW